jgi:LmbE family N-acetylglucosaminyl deacetylase
VVAHPDDETFGCVAVAARRGRWVTTAVCCATRGEAGRPAEGSGIRRTQLGPVREQELRTAARLLGVTRVDLLDFVDSGMSGGASRETLIGADFAEVRDRVMTCLTAFRPDVVVTLDASDGHRDHARIRDATLAAVAQARASVKRVYLQSLPQHLMRRWLDHVAAQSPGSEHLTADVPGTSEELITMVIDTERHLAAFERAMAAHASQLSPYEGLPADLRHAFLTREHLQRVVPAWSGGELERDIFPSANVREFLAPGVRTDQRRSSVRWMRG